MSVVTCWPRNGAGFPLDGGRIAFAVLEKIYQPLFRIRAPLTLAGWGFMLALMVYATVHDLGRIGFDVLS
jgi:membrane-associated protease RseP (regulator of RpoE activity)